MLLKYRWLLFSITCFAILLVSVLVFRFFFGGNEDIWICQGGQWVTHGNPNNEKPGIPCEKKTVSSVNYVDTIGERCGDAPVTTVLGPGMQSEMIAERLVRQWMNFYLNPTTCLSQRIDAYTIDSVTVKAFRSQYVVAFVDYTARNV